MKKLLAPSRRDKPTGGEAKDPNVSSKKLTNKMSDERGKSN
jgi:hypothetical protein